MMALLRHIARWLGDAGLVFRNEWKLLLASPGALIFFLALPLAYPIVYTLIYNPEVVRKIPVCIVDDCRTQASRELARQASAAPAFKLHSYAANMDDAKRLWASQDVYAVLHIPSDYDKSINRGEQAHATLYCDMSLLLRYRALLSTMTGLQLKLANDITQERVDMVGEMAEGMSQAPINSESRFLGDTQQGFASFVIPGIVVLILQQSLILGVALLGGSSRERRRRNGGIDPLEIPTPHNSAMVIGKAMTYLVLYIPLTIYILHFIPEFFSLPHHGSPIDYLLFIFPMLLAAAFLGQAVVALIKEREYVFPVIVFTSVVFLFLSGLTWPRYAMSPAWQVAGNLVPATWGVEGFIRINSNSATLAENSTPYIALWILSAAYFALAVLVTKYLRRSRGLSC